MAEKLSRDEENEVRERMGLPPLPATPPPPAAPPPKEGFMTRIAKQLRAKDPAEVLREREKKAGSY